MTHFVPAWHATQALLLQTMFTPQLVPFVKAIVPEVDVQGGVLVIDPPPGLIDAQAP